MYHRTAQDQRIIVGVDGSECSRAALVWAITQASRTTGIVEVVTTPEDLASADRSRVHRAGLPDPIAVAERHLADLIAEARTELGGPPVAILTRVMRGDPAELLLDVSSDAQLLVVGRGRHGDDLGPVSRRCVQDAHCSVAVITAPPARTIKAA